jgi:hypothetical protein
MVLVLDRENLRRTTGDERGQPRGNVVRVASFSPYIGAMWPMEELARLVWVFMARVEQVEGTEMMLIWVHYDPMEVEDYVMLN